MQTDRQTRSVFKLFASVRSKNALYTTKKEIKFISDSFNLRNEWITLVPGQKSSLSSFLLVLFRTLVVWNSVPEAVCPGRFLFLNSFPQFAQEFSIKILESVQTNDSIFFRTFPQSLQTIAGLTSSSHIAVAFHKSIIIS
jgi:hypothetical protein